MNLKDDETIMDILQRLEALEQTVAKITVWSRDSQEPPLPPKTSRKFEGSKTDIRVRIDSVLFNLLNLDSHRTSAGNLSRTLDIILWRYYGKPKLSWELDKLDKEI